MNFKSNLLLLTAVVLTGHMFACEVDEAAEKGSKKCLKVGSLTVCNNAAIGGNLAVAGSETIAGNLAVAGNEAIAGNETIAGYLVVNGVNASGASVSAAGDLAYDLTGFPAAGLSPVGSLETSFARMAWARVNSDGTLAGSNNSGLTAAAPGTGSYIITFDTAFVNAPVVLVSSAVNESFVVVTGVDAANAFVSTFNTDGTTQADHAFNVIVIGV